MLDNLISWIGSRGNTRGKSLSIPVFDGAFKPNSLLEEADILAEHSGFSDLVAGADNRLLAACENTVVEVSATGSLSEIAAFDRPVTALAQLSDGRLAVGLGDTVVIGVGTDAHVSIDTVDGRNLTAVTALYPAPEGGLLVCDGSKSYGCDDWAWDLMNNKKDGRLIALDAQGGNARVLASGLGYAFGAYTSQETGVLVSESWNHRVSHVADKRAGPAIDRLPGYPCRFAPAEGGGFWLSLFCSRTQLVEFVLKEKDYRTEMMATIDPRFWISPSFGSGSDYLEPLQGGGVKQMGILKPWAPPRSYGLLVRYDANLTPQYSLHSRVGGRHHGICAAAQVGDTLYALSKGSGRIVKMSILKTRATLFGENAA
ncbi:hypothetical protein [Antarcticimicrobium sediminis]|nr:hypothetical protein [Antarcticimicrobium sediminis]